MEITLKRIRPQRENTTELDLKGKELGYINILKINQKKELTMWADLED